MPISNQIVEQLKRISATLLDKNEGSAKDILILKTDWPESSFAGSTNRMRDVLVDRGIDDASDWSDDAIRDEMPSLFQFRFLEAGSRGSFWDGWQNDFPLVDPTYMTPFGSDSNYFYLLAENPDDESLVFSVDHEETDEEPYNGGGMTISQLLTVIELES